MTTDERLDRLIERHEALAQTVQQIENAQLRTEKTLRRAIRLGVREARAERKRRVELDNRVTAAQVRTEEQLQRVGNSLERFLNAFRIGNGHEKGTQT